MSLLCRRPKGAAEHQAPPVRCGQYPGMDRRLDRMTAHILDAAVYIQLMRGRSAAARTLFSRAIDFETAFRVLVHPDMRRRRERRKPLN